MGFQKQKPRIITYCKYKTFDNLIMRNPDQTFLNIISIKRFWYLRRHNFQSFQQDEAPFMTKNLNKQIMKTSRMHNKKLKLKLTEQTTNLKEILQKTSHNY